MEHTNYFRFQNLQIWQMAIEVSGSLLDIADEVEERKHYRFAEQLRGAVMSISNNIAEGSGSTSNKDFQNFLKYSRRSVFEVANILIILRKRDYVSEISQYLKILDEMSRRILAFSRSLK